MTRERRTPAQARSLILASAEQVFATVMPDQVGLRDIAREAGISHALVTHYFGTYDGLVRATLARRIEQARDQVLARLVSAQLTPGQAPLIELLLGAMEDRVMVRLICWAILTGRREQILTGAGSLAAVVAGLEARILVLGLPLPSRAQLEFSVMAAFAMAFGFSIANHELGRAIGRDGPLELEEIRREMPKMFWAYLSSSVRS